MLTVRGKRHGVLRAVILRLLLPMVALVVLFWVLVLALPNLGLAPRQVEGWAWITVVCVGLVYYSATTGEIVGRAGRLDDTSMKLAGRWKGKDFE